MLETKALVKKYTLNLGLTLLTIPYGQKGPTTTGWSKDSKVWITKDNYEGVSLVRCNLGVLHFQSRTCCLDIDDMSKALSALSSLGFPVEELRKEPTAYYGNPERLKVLYRLPSNIEGIPYYKGAGFEFRSGSMQDVLPPSIHPDTGKEYVWVNGIPSTIPEVPSKLLEAIGGLEDETFKQLDKESIRGKISNPLYNSIEGEETLDHVRSALSAFPLEVVDDYHEWIRVGLSLKNCLAKYRDKAWEIWKEWSEQSTKWDEDKARYYWNKLDPKSRTVRSIFKKAEEEFKWVNPIKGKKKSNASIVEDALQLELEEKWKGKLWFIERCENGLSSVAWHEDIKQYIRSPQNEGEVKWVVTQLLSYYRDNRFDEKDEANEVKYRFLSSISNREKLCKGLAGNTGLFSIKLEDFDAIPELWAFEGGIVVNIKTGEVLENQPKYMLLTNRHYKFDPKAKGEFTKQFIEALIPNEEVRKSFISYLCVTALADPSHKIFPFLYGGGNNGKSTLLRWMAKLFGNMGGALSVRAITANRGFMGSDNGLMVVLGKRYVYIDETPEDIVLNTSVVKTLSGGEGTVVEGYAKHEKTKSEIEFNGVSWMASNHKPTLNANDSAIWDRIKLIEFGDPIENPDKDLLKKLTEDLPGAFNLLVTWVKDFVKQGGKVYDSQEVKNAVQEYQEDNDIVQDFINEKLVIDGKKDSVISEYKLWKEFIKYLEQDRRIKHIPIGRREMFKKIGLLDKVIRGADTHIFTGVKEKGSWIDE